MKKLQHEYHSGELVFKNNNLHKGILLLKLEDAVSEEKLAAIQNIILEYLENLKITSLFIKMEN